MKLKKAKQLNGAITVKQDRKPRTMDELFGFTGVSKFGTLNESVFEARLKKMQANDLYTFAREYGIIACDMSDKSERDRVVLNLMNEFRAYKASIGGRDTPKEKPADQFVKDFMAGAR